MPMRSLAITAMLLIGLGPAEAATGSGDAPRASSATQDCWVEHTQLQPSPARPQSKTDERPGAETRRLMSEDHPGAEHASRAKKRSCNSVQPGKAFDAAASEPRVMSR